MQEDDTVFRRLSSQFSDLLHASGAALSDPKVAAYHAAYAKNLFDALVAHGFTSQDAVGIVRAYGFSGGSPRAELG
jgi:hypothetical protein